VIGSKPYPLDLTQGPRANRHDPRDHMRQPSKLGAAVLFPDHEAVLVDQI
jgi:hypothetical protein